VVVHDIIILVLGLAVMVAIIWRVKMLKESRFTDRLDDFTVAVYLIILGAYSIWRSVTAGSVDDIELPAALAKSRGPAGGGYTPSFWFWFAIGATIAAYFVTLNLFTDFQAVKLVSPSFFALLFLAVSMCFFKGHSRFLLGLAAASWAIRFAGLASHGSSGVGILMGAVPFSASVRFIGHAGNLSGLDFGLKDFISSLTSPILILDLSGKVILANDEFLRLGSYARKDVISREAVDLFSFSPDWRLKFDSIDREKRVRCRLNDNSGEQIPVTLWLSELRDSRARLKNLFCVIREERELELLENRVRDESLKFSGLYETSSALSSSLELKDVLRSIGQAAERLTGADSRTIFSLDHARQVLKPIYSSEEVFNSEVMNFELAVGKGLTGAAVSDSRPRIQNFDDETKVAMLIPGTPEDEESILSIPLIARDIVVGALTMYKSGRRRFQDDDLRILTVFAAQASAIIETSRLCMKLKSTERLYRYSVDLAGDAIFFVASETGRISDANEIALKLFKYSKAEFVGLHVWELNPENQMHVTKRLWQEVKMSGWGSLGEVDYIARNGTRFPASVNMSIIFDGEQDHIQWMVRDIRYHKRNLERIGFFHQIFEKLCEPILITNPKSKTLYANKAFCSLFMVDPEYIVQGNIASVDLRNFSLEVLTECWAKLAGQDRLISHIAVSQRQGSEIRKTISVIPHLGDHGELIYHVWFFHPPADTPVRENLHAVTTK